MILDIIVYNMQQFNEMELMAFCCTHGVLNIKNVQC